METNVVIHFHEVLILKSQKAGRCAGWVEQKETKLVASFIKRKRNEVSDDGIDSVCGDRAPNGKSMSIY